MAVINETTKVVLRSNAVRDLAKRDGVTISALAGQCGWSRDYLHKILNGTRPCSWTNLMSLAAALRVEPTTIADVEPPMARAA